MYQPPQAPRGPPGTAPPPAPAPMPPGYQQPAQHSTPRAHFNSTQETDAELLTAPTIPLDETGSFLDRPFHPKGMQDVLAGSLSAQKHAAETEREEIRRFREASRVQGAAPPRTPAPAPAPAPIPPQPVAAVQVPSQPSITPKSSQPAPATAPAAPMPPQLAAVQVPSQSSTTPKSSQPTPAPTRSAATAAAAKAASVRASTTSTLVEKENSVPETTSLRQSTSTGPVQTGVQHQQTSSSPPPPQPQPAGPAEDQEKASMQTVAPNPHVSGSTEKTATVEQQRRDSQDQKAADGSAQVSAIMTKGQARKGPGDLPSTQKHATARVHKEKETKNATEEPKRGAQGQMTRQQQQQHPQPPGKPRLIFPKSMSSLLRAKPNAGVGPVDKTKAAVTPTQRDERQHHPEEEKKDRTDTDTSTSSRPKLLPKKRRLRRRRFIDDEAEVDEEGDVPSADEVEDTAEDLLMDGFIVDDNDEVTYSSSQEEQCGDPAVPAENERGTYRSLDNLHESAAEKQPTLARGPNPAKKARTSPRDIPGHVRIAIGPAPSPSSANARAHGRKKTGPPPEMIDLERPRRISVEHLMDMIKSPDRLWPAYKILCQAVRRDMSSILKDNCGEECFKLSDPELLEAIRVLLALAESVLLPRSLALKHAQMENESDRDPTLHGRYISEQVSAVQKFDEQFKQENMLQSDAVFGPEQVEALRENFKGRPGSVYPFARLFSRLNTLRSYAFCEVEMEEEDDDDNEHKRTEPHRCSVTGRTISPGDRVYLLQVYSYCDEATRARGEDRACFYISRHHGYPHLYIGQVCVYITYRWQRSKFIKRILDWSEKVMKFGPSATGLDRLAAFLRHKNVTHVAAILEEYLAFKWLFNVYVNRGPQANDGAPTSSGGKDNGGDGKIDAQSATAKEVPGKRRRVSAPLRVGQQNAQVILNRF